MNYSNPRNLEFGVFASFSSAADSDNVERYLLERVNNIITMGVSKDELRRAELKVINDVKEMSKNLGFIGSRTELLGEGELYANNPDCYLQRLRRQQIKADRYSKHGGKMAKEKRRKIVATLEELICFHNKPSSV